LTVVHLPSSNEIGVNSPHILMKNLAFSIAICSFLIPAGVAQACVDYYVQAPNFDYNPQLLSPTMGVTTINITKFTCPQPVYLRVNPGNSLRYQKRQMNNGSQQLKYNFYTQPTSTSAIWGDGSGGTHIQQVSGATSINLYTIIDPQQDMVPGAYADSINFQFAP
jgi:spore coat protein U-like protein